VARQGEGYIPLLGSAQDLALRATPTRRRVAAVLEECSHAVFPWLGFVLAGALHPGARRFAAWLAMALVLGGAWTVFMGPVALPVLVPAAVCGALALRTLVVGREPLQRRFALFVVALATLVTRQDAALHTVEIALPSVAATIPYPAETLAAADRLQTIAGLVLLASIAATLLGGRTTTARWRRDLRRRRAAPRAAPRDGTPALAPRPSAALRGVGARRHRFRPAAPLPRAGPGAPDRWPGDVRGDPHPPRPAASARGRDPACRA